jgi:hypothetical protein
MFTWTIKMKRKKIAEKKNNYYIKGGNPTVYVNKQEKRFEKERKNHYLLTEK